MSITSTSGDTARYALTQSLAVGDATPRRLTVRGLVKGAGLSEGFTMIRVQAYDASGRVTVPVARGPYLRGSFDWREYSTDLVLPEGTTRVSVEPMLDRSSGTVWFTDISIEEDTKAGSLTASPTPNGTVELSWSIDVEQAARYAVHRAEGEQPPKGDSSSLVRSAVATTTADDTVGPAATYTYQVQALDDTGTIIATTPTATVATPTTFADRTETTVLTGIEDGDGMIHASWAVAHDRPHTELTIQVGNRAPRHVEGYDGGFDLAGEPGDEITLRSGDVVLATAQVGGTTHPRALLDTGTVARVNEQLREGDETTTAAWEAMIARIAGPDSGYPGNGSGGLYRAREAAFVYGITGDQDYADQAYEALVSAEEFVAPRPVNMGLELARANLLLAPTYDWAFNGWTDAQRSHVRDIITRSIDLLSTYHHEALDDTEKTSNWVGVVRSTELALLLAARGDADFGNHDDRITFLLDETNRHLEQAYTDTGLTQEGWDYLHYTELYMFPSIYAAQDSGVRTLDAQFSRPAFWNLALHVVSSRSHGDTLQFGVSGPNGQVDGSFPLMFPITPDAAVPGLKHLYDRVQGIRSDNKNLDGIHGLWTVLFYPEDVSSDAADLAAADAHTALLDEEQGFYAFRSEYRDRDDTLVGTASRNAQHRGWSSAETFSLTWMSHDTTWATLGGKRRDDPLAWSKPLVDGKLEPYRNQYETVTGDGRTLEARAFPDQGGGYVRMDGSGNFLVDTAVREEVVDLAPGGDADAIVAIRDTFADDVSHTWDWQIRPEAGVAITIVDDAAENEPYFTLTSPNGAVLSGFVVDRAGMSAEILDGTLRLTRRGTEAEFRVVLATSDSATLNAEIVDGRLVIDGRVVNFDALDDSTAAGLPRRADDGATAPPAAGVLSSDNGHDTGLRDGDYTITMNTWWGENASRFRLFENGTLIDSVDLDPNTPHAQAVTIPVTGRTNGTYTYTGELTNSRGTTSIGPLTVSVTQAKPAKPVLSHDNYDRDGSFTLTGNLWWGTNGTGYRFYQDGVLIAEGAIEAATPEAQSVVHEVEGLAPGVYAFRVEWENYAGTTSSDVVEVTVR
ncbi:hypothetical protein [Myceligenerans salitolerans]|uniref:Fibronectin type-III domain-containing protein n=1 Tax=Myceligenerans salitolerans TaxID=1230528 RepID=A0ABS3IBE2_9MICO|nr:hypothetical protein [Myceligenerans salitolerans]MBO0610362.1 hypothetical protein [Myceligenerans salitolerans]